MQKELTHLRDLRDRGVLTNEQYERAADGFESGDSAAAAFDAAAAERSLAEDLERLADLRRRGILSESDFTSAKRRRLSLGEHARPEAQGVETAHESAEVGAGVEGMERTSSVDVAGVERSPGQSRGASLLRSKAFAITAAVVLLAAVGAFFWRPWSLLGDDSNATSTGGPTGDQAVAVDSEFGADCGVGDTAGPPGTDIVWAGVRTDLPDDQFGVIAYFDGEVPTPGGTPQQGDVDMDLTVYLLGPGQPGRLTDHYVFFVHPNFGGQARYELLARRLEGPGRPGGSIDPDAVSLTVEGNRIAVIGQRSAFAGYDFDNLAVVFEVATSRYRSNSKELGFFALDEQLCPPKGYTGLKPVS